MLKTSKIFERKVIHFKGKVIHVHSSSCHPNIEHFWKSSKMSEKALYVEITTFAFPMTTV